MDKTAVRQAADLSVQVCTASLLIVGNGQAAAPTLLHRLAANGYAVGVAHNANQALKLILNDPPDLLIIDSRLRGPGSARHLCHQVKQNDALGFLPVILTVSPDETSYDDDLDGEADATLLKPVEPDELLSWVRFLLRIKRQIDRLMDENRQLVIAARQVELLKSDIIRNVSHELATPLLQVKSAVALLTDDIQEIGTPQQVEMADMAATSIGRLESLVENVRQLVQTHDIHVGPIIIGEAIDLGMRYVERSWSSRDGRHRIEMLVDSNLPFVKADKRAVARLVQLLLDNALKFSPPDSPVLLRVRQADDDHVEIGVRDFGIGIAADEQRRIFQAFYQVDGSSTRQYDGAGTGLALALLLATGMHTTIQIDSELGQGSTFWFLLPVATPDDFTLDLL